MPGPGAQPSRSGVLPAWRAQHWPGSHRPNKRPKCGVPWGTRGSPVCNSSILTCRWGHVRCVGAQRPGWGPRGEGQFWAPWGAATDAAAARQLSPELRALATTVAPQMQTPPSTCSGWALTSCPQSPDGSWTPTPQWPMLAVRPRVTRQTNRTSLGTPTSFGQHWTWDLRHTGALGPEPSCPQSQAPRVPAAHTGETARPLASLSEGQCGVCGLAGPWEVTPLLSCVLREKGPGLLRSGGHLRPLQSPGQSGRLSPPPHRWPSSSAPQGEAKRPQGTPDPQTGSPRGLPGPRMPWSSAEPSPPPPQKDLGRSLAPPC
ncbi:uncharacterized protein LOC110348943 [Heterocephalus glaber]|uniref:Uncharacterized protein LOC110348943 n=1 Tax=Heterocephalus glaber TaxID=10181 RepID=A0AAX6SVK8_HETGA|nr:uncharacterized protein LOC110348943 [Heterocephalus glaber]XP_021113351.1 uncharacterized protein LOC110348943 [Heterocephalus glaber]